MKSPKKKVNKGLIILNKGERIAVISLLSIIAILLAFSVFRPSIKLTKKERLAFHNLDSLIAVQEKTLLEEKAKTEERAKNVATTKPEPTVQKRQATTRTSKQKAVTQSSENERKSYPKETKKIPILDINQADSLALVELPQIGAVMASRIHRYRNRLGGFVSMEQLFEIKGMDTARFEAIKPYIVLEISDIRKLDVNRDEFKALLRHPYLEYDQVKAIVNHRERNGLIKNWEQLKEIVDEINPLLEKYVRY
ncbi:MAG: helix-hairpin-helix domain-containing protein [Bacteroidales bacterium]|nr:helix-hairpin-helix domain-containing protein [Bacteroidales bacterium]